MAFLRASVLTCLMLALLAGCSESTDPAETPADGLASGAVDPAAGRILFKTVVLDMPPVGRARLELLGSDMILDPDGQHIDLTVRVRNAGDAALPGALWIWLEDFVPPEVSVANADTTQPPQPSLLPVMPWAFAFIYNEEFGADGVLEPGEVSAARVWRFRTMEQEPFGFGLRLERGSDPDGPAISGRCFWDEDRDGVPDRGEPALFPGRVRVVAPDGAMAEMFIDERGGYRYPLTAAGLYTVSYHQDFETFAPIVFSTPNPRHVVITAGADGDLLGFHGAHFGAHNLYEPGPPPVRFTDLPADSLHQVDFRLLDADLDVGDILELDLGFSGCDDDHMFSLWMSGGFMESNPVQVNLVPVHETDQACQAAFRRTRSFDLAPLRARFREAYGDGAHEMLVNISDTGGTTIRLLWNLAEDDDKPRD